MLHYNQTALEHRAEMDLEQGSLQRRQVLLISTLPSANMFRFRTLKRVGFEEMKEPCRSVCLDCHDTPSCSTSEATVTEWGNLVLLNSASLDTCRHRS